MLFYVRDFFRKNRAPNYNRCGTFCGTGTMYNSKRGIIKIPGSWRGTVSGVARQEVELITVDVSRRHALATDTIIGAGGMTKGLADESKVFASASEDALPSENYERGEGAGERKSLEFNLPENY